MKKLLLLMLLICIATSNLSLNAQTDFKSVTAIVGKQPVAIFPCRDANNLELPNYDTLNIICMGIDENFNGVLDENDELPSWWKIEGVKNANPNNPNANPVTVRKIMDFEANWGGFFPFRCGTVGNNVFPSPHSNLLVIPEKNAIRFFDISNEADAEMTINNIVGTKSVVVSGSGSTLFVSMRDYAEENNWIPIANYVKIFEGHNNYEFSDSIPTGNNVQRVISYDLPIEIIANEIGHFAVLCEGGAGEESTVGFYTRYFNGYGDVAAIIRENIEIGKGGNELVMHNIMDTNGIYKMPLPFFFAISDADSKITIIGGLFPDLKILFPYFDSNVIQLPEFSSPREMSIKETIDEKTGEINYSAFISTNSNKIFYLPDLRKTKEFVEIETPEISEAILNIKQDRIVCAYTNIYKELYVLPSNTVTILYEGETSIDADLAVNNFIVFPNPINDVVNIITSKANEVKNIKILDIEGRTLQEISKFITSSNDLLQFRLNSKLASGKYFIQLETTKEILTQSIVVQ